MHGDLVCVVCVESDRSGRCQIVRGPRRMVGICRGDAGIYVFCMDRRAVRPSLAVGAKQQGDAPISTSRSMACRMAHIWRWTFVADEAHRFIQAGIGKDAFSVYAGGISRHVG